MEMDRLHRLEELEGNMKKTRLLFRGQRFKILEALAPESSHFGILREWPGDLAQRGCRGVLRGKLGDARAAMQLHREIPKRHDDAERTDQLRGCVNRFPIHSLRYSR